MQTTKQKGHTTLEDNHEALTVVIKQYIYKHAIFENIMSQDYNFHKRHF